MQHASSPSDMGIRLDRATYAAGGRTILSGISLHLTERRIGILGPNGSGKTTLLRLMAGLVAPTDGRVTVEGIEPASDRRAMLGAIGILFQNPEHQIIFPTVEEELAFGLKQMGRSAAEARRAARDLLAAHGRAHWAAASVATLSQGQKQFLCLLSVLAMAPRTILLDEPFSGLDLPTQIRLSRRLAALPQRLVTISHDPAAVADHDRVIWLEQGRVRADGPAPEVASAFRAEMEHLGGLDADADLAG
ncbi:energy-coupling factor ABC transporter ATP-binding protein [Cereibacter azotoformans]|uniref:Biotin transport system ATP-binding protein n=1 Tax=Cereibacter azotoformans TaxID=43057 RepID=A0A2T5KBY1_9RHOB|nr:ABC transporter ATP-binding protein [Cereibacter azotoformans]AXQ94197.1 ABC transporter ATP-binding protein [Cereibacter sphaeroides]MBO4167995.1 ABC transporter ATP-binding protein [Cereibacter azotoformans]PTR19927.1 biotin transport system ATP-binding protein [Cereibacter azotoformans]UIJ29735.1 energy-coupling factor ABC transporter ATP-binding protein [Cereibacter azotoformans]